MPFSFNHPWYAAAPQTSQPMERLTLDPPPPDKREILDPRERELLEQEKQELQQYKSTVEKLLSKQPN